MEGVNSNERMATHHLLRNYDYSGIQKKAMEMGIPYQTLISGLIHRYIEGDVKVKT